MTMLVMEPALVLCQATAHVSRIFFIQKFPVRLVDRLLQKLLSEYPTKACQHGLPVTLY